MASIGIADKITLDAVNSKSTTIINNTGDNSDPANPYGTTHAKLKDLRQYVGNLATLIQKPRTIVRGSVRTTKSDDYITVLDIEGIGSLKMLFLSSLNDSTSTNYAGLVRVSIDGVLIGEGGDRFLTGDGGYRAFLPSPIFFMDPSNSHENVFKCLDTSSLDLPFRSSLLIEAYNNFPLMNSAYVGWVYEIE